MDAGFIKYLAEQRGFQPGDTIATKQQYDALYKDYIKGSDSFRPTSVPVTNAVTKEVSAAMMTSPNSAALMKERAQPMKTYVGADGKLYAVDAAAGSANVITNSDGSAFRPDPKANATVEAIDRLMDRSNGKEAEPEPAGNGFLSGLGSDVRGLFFGASPSPSPTPTPTATPEPAERPMPQQAPPPAQAAAATPSTFSQTDFERQFGAKLAPGKYDYDGQLVIITP
jgi:hypothetical protein